jgi:hypothetical protein
MAYEQQAVGGMEDLPRLRSYRSKKISSWDRAGGNRDFVVIGKGGSHTVADIKGAGCIKHIWITVACEDLLYPRKIQLQMYWDGERHPSVDCPLGDFFGVGHGQTSHYVSAPLSMICSEPPLYNRAGMNCFFPMPFARSARIVVKNECDRDVWAFFYHVTYEEYESLEEGLGRFHAQWLRENPCQGWGEFMMPDPYEAFRLNPSAKSVFDVPNLDGAGNYVILEAEGTGHFVGCNLSIHNITNKAVPWFGEGDEMIFIDGEAFPPSIHGTGTEDYFCAAFGFPGKFHTPFFGVSLAGDPRTMGGKWTLYRYHLDSPINFSKSIRVTIEHGHANKRWDDYSSVAYWYQSEPHRPFPEMLPVQQRLPRAELTHTLRDYEMRERPITE